MQVNSENEFNAKNEINRKYIENINGYENHFTIIKHCQLDIQK